MQEPFLILLVVVVCLFQTESIDTCKKSILITALRTRYSLGPPTVAVSCNLSQSKLMVIKFYIKRQAAGA